MEEEQQVGVEIGVQEGDLNFFLILEISNKFSIQRLSN